MEVSYQNASRTGLSFGLPAIRLLSFRQEERALRGNTMLCSRKIQYSRGTSGPSPNLFAERKKTTLSGSTSEV